MSRHPGNELQTAIYTALTGSAAIQDLCGSAPNTRVFDSVPASTQYPYIAIGDDSFVDGGSHSAKGVQATVTIHSWAQAEGRKQVKQIMEAIYDLMHEGSLSLSGHVLVLMRMEFEEILKDPDGRTHHGVQRFRVITREGS